MNSKKNIQSYGRFKNLPWFDKISQSTIFVGGAGGIGSHLVFYLARAGANVIVVDMDTVEEANLAGQLYGKEDIGKEKVIALNDVIDRLCGENNVTPMNTEITEEPAQWQSMIQRCDAVVVGFDNLKARGIIYKEWRANGKEDSIFIDGRLGAESFQVFALTKQSTDDEFAGYEQTYFSDEERAEVPCTMKATTHWGAGIGWWIMMQITNWFNNTGGSIMPRDISNANICGPLSMIEQPILKPREHGVVQVSV